MERITTKNLQAAVGVMARMMDLPAGPIWTRRADGSNVATVGVLLLNVGSKTYGNAWGVAQICNEAGGERTLLRASTARELWEAIHAWRAGYDYAAQQGKAAS